MKQTTLKIQSEIDFGFCPVGETARLEFSVSNTSREETTFVWLSKDPFKISPQNGTIQGRKQQVFEIFFRPCTASRFDGTLICRFGKDLLEKSEIVAIGVAKVPHISLSTTFIDFGKVPSSAKATQILTVHNSAPVPATVDISSDFNQLVVQPTKVSLKPQGSENVKISFHPTNFDFFAFANINFSTAGGNSAKLRCEAYVTGPKVTLDHTSLPLGNVQLKNFSSNIFNVVNHSNRRIFFQFLIEPTSVFSFDPIQGILPPNYSKSIRVTFTPQNPIVYYRRVILIVHQHPPLAIDVFGSAYDTFNHPPRLKAQHIDWNHKVISEGLGNKPPHLLPKVTEYNMPEIDYVTGDLKRNKCTLNAGSHIFNELFTQRDLISLSSNHFEFGACQRDVSPDVQTLSVKNNTDSVVSLFWQNNKDGFVTMTPNNVEIPKKQTAEINIRFNPKLEFQFMGATLEGFVQYKEMRNANIVDFPTLPFLISPFIDGHTMDDVTSFIPTMFTSHKTVVFAGAIAGDSKFQTFFVENRGDCAFKFYARIIDAEKPDKNTVQSSSSAFSVYPQVGTINKGSFQIFVVRFSPSQRGHYHAQLFAAINDSPMNNFIVNLKGDASVPGVSFSVTGTLFLHPVSLGSISTQTIQISNDSTVPVKIEWKIPTIYQQLLIVKPQSTEIRSREVIDCEWEFHPDSVGEFRVEVVCNVQALSNYSNEYISHEILPFIVGPESLNIDQQLVSSLKTVQHYPLTVCTLVTDCIVNSKPQKIDFGFVRINSAATSTLSISNHSDSQMHFLLQPGNPALKLLQFTPADDVLPPRSSRDVEVRFTPHLPGDVGDTILCSLLNETIFQQADSGRNLSKMAIKSSANEICSVKGIGCFPHLKVTDVFSPKYSRDELWMTTSANSINSELNLLGCDSLADDLKTFTIDFGSDVVSSEPSLIYIKFENIGHIAFNFSINFPNDVSIDPEYWALPDEIDPDQMKQDQIMQAKLFRVSEKKFHLEPKETTIVCFTYLHKFIESHHLPVVLSIQNGRIIRLLLRGTTLDPTIPHVIPRVSKFNLQPVPIGAIDPPIQILQIFNPSANDADFRFDLTQVQEVSENNHNFEIFRCLTPSGIVKSRSTCFIQFIFKPLEAIEYEVSILCLISNGNNFTVTMKGRGIHTDHEECLVEWPTFPPRSLTIPDVSPITLSEQFVDFGDLPVFAHTDRMIFMENTSDQALEFEADIVSDFVKIEPRKGEIKPGKQQLLTLSVYSPDLPTIFCAPIPIIFNRPLSEEERSANQSRQGRRDEDEEEVIAADPPINSNARGKGGRLATLRRLREREENWKSVGERTLEASKKINQSNSRLFSTHIGKRGPQNFERVGCAALQFIDVVFNTMSKTDYRDKYGSIDTYYFDAQNSHKIESFGTQKDEINDFLISLVDNALADEQQRKLAMSDAQIRRQNIPLFSQLYKEDPVIDLPQAEVQNLKHIDDIHEVLRGIIDEVIMEADEGKFSLDKEIIHVSGFKTMH
ncbi:hypothetical protein TRFO_08149 [Tritrichomonas foetus]|uniref:Abnormal spindle-like microcephaly-associated protein ASH domain-containing protein n=1 Tax=Tritrichomonas foetus TaxID=1144522 RepID=A0A1J4JQR4_9EUKA|nr:hypothetical protein TRFO_08149 [Tritrichomonas foetus]|eukprot:OHS99859.1 hypothetical protein TRFO_08149 [Tritrichomonas foetus]